MKKIVTMQDISCVGKCSLTAALPVISAMGIETAVLPTAVLSTHTMFRNPTFCDLSDQIEVILDHWEENHFSFDAIYTGYLGSLRQMDLARELIFRFRKGPVLVDPCMADNGKLYAGFTNEFVDEMRNFCAEADIICPNLSEACFMLKIPYQEKPDEEMVRKILKYLTRIGCHTAILTGISFNDTETGAYAYNRDTDTYTYVSAKKQKESFHGTGDLWASCFIGALVRGKSFEASLKLACQFVSRSIELTLQEDNHNTYGVNFEQALPDLIRSL